MTFIPSGAPPLFTSTGPTSAELYRGEAARLRRLAAAAGFHDVGDELRDMAAEYEVLAAQREQLDRHRFGEPLQRPVSAGHPPADERQDNERSRERTG